MRINCFGRNGLKRFSFNFSLAPFRPQPLMIFNPGHCADGCFVFAFFPGVETPGYYNQTLSGFSLSTSLLFLIPYSLPVRSGGYIPYFFYILQTEVSFSFRPQPLLVFNPGHSADGVLFFFLTRGCVRSSLTPGYYNQTPSEFSFSAYLLFLISYSLPVLARLRHSGGRSGGDISYLFYILQTEVSFSFRPQPLLVFNPGHSADGGFVVPFLSRGCVRFLLTPVTIIKSLQDFQPSIFVIPYSIFLILSSNPSPCGDKGRGLYFCNCWYKASKKSRLSAVR